MRPLSGNVCGGPGLQRSTLGVGCKSREMQKYAQIAAFVVAILRRGAALHARSAATTFTGETGRCDLIVGASPECRYLRRAGVAKQYHQHLLQIV